MKKRLLALLLCLVMVIGLVPFALAAEAEEEKLPEEKLLFAKNKWLIAHEEGGEEGAFIGLTGKNISVDDLVI